MLLARYLIFHIGVARAEVGPCGELVVEVLPRVVAALIVYGHSRSRRLTALEAAADLGRRVLENAAILGDVIGSALVRVSLPLGFKRILVVDAAVVIDKHRLLIEAAGHSLRCEDVEGGTRAGRRMNTLLSSLLEVVVHVGRLEGTILVEAKPPDALMLPVVHGARGAVVTVSGVEELHVADLVLDHVHVVQGVALDLVSTECLRLAELL